MPNIVQVNVSLQQAPLPNNLQQSGALISQGGTTLSPGTLSAYLPLLSSLTALLASPRAMSGLTWTTNVATGTTAAPHGYTMSDTIWLTIAGVTPTAYNGTFLCTITGASTFTYALLTNPGGASSVPGTFGPGSINELTQMGTTFFAQGTAQGVYVLELGPGSVADGVTALTTYLTANPSTLYGVLVPREWDGDSDLITLIQSFESTTSKFYFWITTTTGTYTDYTALMKDVVTLIESPNITSNEFSLAAAFYKALAYNPSSTNKVTPFAFSQLFGVTPYPMQGTQALLTTLKAAAVNVVLTGAEGGLTGTFLYWGTTMDGHDFTWWYSIDWMQIQSQLFLANAVINGSNNPLNPLDYDQFGINRLQAVEAQVVTNAIIFGLATGTLIQTELDGPGLAQALDANAFTNQAVVNAVPFVPYATANPSDFAIGKYAGLSVIYIVARGFTQIVLNLIATDFVTF